MLRLPLLSFLSLCLMASAAGCQSQSIQTTYSQARFQVQSDNWKQGNAHSGGSLTGQFKKHTQVPSSFLDNKRDVLVWLPPGYDLNNSKRYSVMYVHDGNNLFDRRTTFGGVEWQLDEKAEQLIQQQRIEPVILVGVYNTAARMEEYLWHADNYNGKMMGGKGRQYADFLVKELKPFIDQNYRTQPDKAHTGIMGSSLGGLISFYTARAYPDTFSKVGMVSPSVWWKNEQSLQDIATFPGSTKIWVDMGTREGSNPEAMLNTAKNFVTGLEKAGFKHFENLAFHIEAGADHSEAAWSQRIHRPLEFFYGK